MRPCSPRTHPTRSSARPSCCVQAAAAATKWRLEIHARPTEQKMDCFKLVLTLDNFSSLLHVWGPFTYFPHRHSQHWWGAISPPSCTLFLVYKLKCMFKARLESGAAAVMRHIMAAKQNLLFACLHKAAVHQQRRQAVQVGPTWLGTLKCSPAGALVALRVERSADCVRQSEERLFGIWKQMYSFDELSVFFIPKELSESTTESGEADLLNPFFLC